MVTHQELHVLSRTVIPSKSFADGLSNVLAHFRMWPIIVYFAGVMEERSHDKLFGMVQVRHYSPQVNRFFRSGWVSKCIEMTCQIQRVLAYGIVVRRIVRYKSEGYSDLGDYPAQDSKVCHPLERRICALRRGQDAPKDLSGKARIGE